MKNSCDMIRDLLPLYVDDACSETSKQLVEEHLSECASCKELLAQLNNHDVEDELIRERNTVVTQHNKEMKRVAYTVGMSVAAVLMIPILVTFIVNLATGRTLDWFFIVLTSLFVVASLTVVPLVKRSNKLLWTMITFTISVVILLMTIAIFTGGNWFFVAAIPTISGLTIFFLPYILYKCPQKGILRNCKGLISMVVDSLLIYLIVIVALIYANATSALATALLTVTLSLILPWVLFLIIRYLKMNGFTKAGLCVGFIAFYNLFFGSIIERLYNNYTGLRITHMDFSNWSDNLALNANIDFIVLMSLGFITIVLCVIGATRRKPSAVS